MIIKGNSYNFGRCLKVAFVKGNDEYFTVIHAPEKDPLLYVAMDVTVTDRPSARAKNNPGFQGTVTIYNPSEEILNIINEHATWVSDYVEENMNEEERVNAIERFYNSRLTCTVSAGYLNDNKDPEWNVILKGYVMGSSLARKGIEDVLTFGVFNIDMFKESMVVEKELDKYRTSESYENQRVLESIGKNKFEQTWYDTLVKYIKQWELFRLPTPKSVPNTKRQTQYYTSTPAQQSEFPDRKDISKITEEETPFAFVSDTDRKNNDWFTIRFAKSLNLWKKLTHYAGYDWENSAVDVDLEVALKSQIMPSNGAIYGGSLAEMLDGLCAQASVRVGWYKDERARTRNTYVIYRLGAEPLWVKGEAADIKIWNYQNLLESPSVSGAGIMTVKMIFNPQCECGLNLALMLDKSLKAKDGAVRDLTMSGEMGSLATSSSVATFGNVQIGSSNAVAAVNKKEKTAKSRGYMFNIGFPIMSVKHELSTHRNLWTTTVQTVPCTAGLTQQKTKALKGEN